LPPVFPGIVVVQHMPPKFTRAFAERLNGLCQLRVKEAEDGDRLSPSHVLVAPGDCHMRLARDGGQYGVRVSQDPPVNRHRPSVDVLFESCAAVAGANAVGILLTGMGDDGARGLLQMRHAGAHTFAQDEASSIVFGMPRAAIALQAADHVVSLGRLPAAVVDVLRQTKEPSRSPRGSGAANQP
jgi:two-component system chemotaxis response regulator CheB